MTPRMIRLTTLRDEQGEWTVLLARDKHWRTARPWALVFLLGEPDVPSRRHHVGVDPMMMEVLLSGTPAQMEQEIRGILNSREAARLEHSGAQSDNPPPDDDV